MTQTYKAKPNKIQQDMINYLHTYSIQLDNHINQLNTPIKRKELKNIIYTYPIQYNHIKRKYITEEKKQCKQYLDKLKQEIEQAINEITNIQPIKNINDIQKFISDLKNHIELIEILKFYRKYKHNITKSNLIIEIHKSDNYKITDKYLNTLLKDQLITILLTKKINNKLIKINKYLYNQISIEKKDTIPNIISRLTEITKNWYQHRKQLLQYENTSYKLYDTIANKIEDCMKNNKLQYNNLENNIITTIRKNIEILIKLSSNNKQQNKDYTKQYKNLINDIKFEINDILYNTKTFFRYNIQKFINEIKKSNNNYIVKQNIEKNEIIIDINQEKMRKIYQFKHNEICEPFRLILNTQTNEIHTISDIRYKNDIEEILFSYIINNINHILHNVKKIITNLNLPKPNIKSFIVSSHNNKNIKIYFESNNKYYYTTISNTIKQISKTTYNKHKKPLILLQKTNTNNDIAKNIIIILKYLKKLYNTIIFEANNTINISIFYNILHDNYELRKKILLYNISDFIKNRVEKMLITNNNYHIIRKIENNKVYFQSNNNYIHNILQNHPDLKNYIFKCFIAYNTNKLIIKQNKNETIKIIRSDENG